MSFASCQRGDTKCTSAPNSSKQNRKKRCGYQCRQKCQNLRVRGPFLLAPRLSIADVEVGLQTLASARHKARISSATSACTLSNRSGCPRFAANITISALETARYPSATHSKGPHTASDANSSGRLLALTRCESKTLKRALSSGELMPGCQTVANSFPRCSLPDVRLIPRSPKSLQRLSVPPACSVHSALVFPPLPR